mgnify:FL=1
MNFIIKQESLLLDYLYENIKGKSKNNIKNYLKDSVYVNNKKISKFDYKLKPGDKLTIIIKKVKNELNNIDIIYEDKDFLVVNKPCGVLTIATNKEREKTLYHYALEYLSKKRQQIFVVHRLDKDTSGVVIFVKNIKMKNILQDNWNELVTLRKYIAIVHGNVNNSGTLKSYLSENKNLFVYETDSSHGKLAITKYKKIKSNNKYSLVEIEILTGRKNQIRVQFANIGNPIVGDKKYGTNDKTVKQMFLHAEEIRLRHPITKKEMHFVAQIDSSFIKLMK